MQARKLSRVVIPGLLCAFVNLVIATAPAGAQQDFAPRDGLTTGGPRAPHVDRTLRQTSRPGIQNLNHDVRYRVVSIGVLPGRTNSVTSERGVNNLGHAAGYSYTPGQIFNTGQAFFWQNGHLTGLPTLSGYTGSFGFAINDLDQVVGVANRRDDSGHVRQTAVLWNHGQPHDLGSLQPNSQSAAFDASIFGVIVGQNFSFDTLLTLPVVWYGGAAHQLPLLPGETQGAPIEINAFGMIVGSQWVQDVNEVPCIWYWNGSGYTAVNLGTAGGNFNQGLGINNLGQAVGWTNFVGDEHGPGFVWDFVHGMQFLYQLPGDTDGLAFGINDFGVILGLSVLATPDDFEVHSVIWQHGTPTDLQTLVPPGTPPFTFGVSNINNLGEISLDATDPDGNPIALLLVPTH
jgi:uncharacterized membrane protein